MFMANYVKTLLTYSQILAPRSVLPLARWSADGARKTERVIALCSNSETGSVFPTLRDFGQGGTREELREKLLFFLH